jgi:hypothetical protein
MNRKLRLASALAAAALGCSTPAAHAGPAPDVVTNGNAWSITAYDDSSPAHTQWATQNICFYVTGTVGTQLAGYWYSTSFYDWNGTWRQEGDQVFMTGDYAGDVNGNAVGHDGIEWQLFTAEKASQGYGHWREWRENGGMGTVIGYANTRLVRTGTCAYRPPAGTDHLTLERLLVQESMKAPRRYRSDGKEALGPTDVYQVPVQQ